MGNCFSENTPLQQQTVAQKNNNSKSSYKKNSSASSATKSVSSNKSVPASTTEKVDTSFSFTPVHNDPTVEKLRNCETIEELHQVLKDLLLVVDEKKIQKSVSLRDILIDKSLVLVSSTSTSSTLETTILFCRFFFWFISDSEGAKKSCRTNIGVRDTLLPRIFDVLKQQQQDQNTSSLVNDIICSVARSIVVLTGEDYSSTTDVGQNFLSESDALFVSLVKTFQTKATSLDCACFLMHAIDNTIGTRVFSPEGFCRALSDSFVHPDTTAESVHRVAEMTNKIFAFSSEMVIHDALVEALKRQTKSVSKTGVTSSNATSTSSSSSATVSLTSSHTTTPQQASLLLPVAPPTTSSNITSTSTSSNKQNIFVTRKRHAYRQICQAICIFSKYEHTAEKFLCTEAVREAVLDCYHANKEEEEERHHHQQQRTVGEIGVLSSSSSFGCCGCETAEYNSTSNNNNTNKNSAQQRKQQHCANCALACILSFEKGKKHFQDSKSGSEFVEEITSRSVSAATSNVFNNNLVKAVSSYNNKHIPMLFSSSASATGMDEDAFVLQQNQLQIVEEDDDDNKEFTIGLEPSEVIMA